MNIFGESQGKDNDRYRSRTNRLTGFETHSVSNQIQNPTFSGALNLVSPRVFEWNTLESDLVQLYSSLVDLGMEYREGKVYLADLEEEDV